MRPDPRYENPAVWRQERSQDEFDRRRETLAQIPSHVSSLLEVGCGDGFILDAASSPGFACGVDGSREALRRAKGVRAQALASALPFPASSFDLVLCLEVLEHLTTPDYAATLSELQRVARTYILVTVPNSEILRHTHVTCPRCHCSFSLHRHLRSFSAGDLPRLFGDFELTHWQTISRTKRPFGYGVGKSLAVALGLTSPFPPTAACPQCRYEAGPELEATERTRSSPSSGRLKTLVTKLLPGRSKGKWLLGLFERPTQATSTRS